MFINGKAPEPSATHLSIVFFLRPGGGSEDGHQETAAARAILGLKGSPSPVSLLHVVSKNEALGAVLGQLTSQHLLLGFRWRGGLTHCPQTQ